MEAANMKRTNIQSPSTYSTKPTTVHGLLSDSDYQKFLEWKRQTQSRFVEFRLVYFDITGDLVAGTLLAQIMYWFSRSKNGQPRVEKFTNGRYWLAKKRSDWFEECRISAKQYDRAIAILEDRGFVSTKVMKFGGTPMPHLSVNWRELNEQIVSAESAAQNGTKILTNDENGSCPYRQIDNPQAVKSLTNSNTSDNHLNNNNDHCVGSPNGEEQEMIPHADLERLTREFLAACQLEKVYSSTTTDAEIVMTKEFVALASLSFRKDWVVRHLIYAAKQIKSSTISKFFDEYRDYLNERAWVYQWLKFRPDELTPEGRVLCTLLARWGHAYWKFHGARYQFNEKDVASACDFVERDPGIDPNESIRYAGQAWEDTENLPPSKGYDKHFFSRKAKTLSGFIRHYQRILEELEVQKG